MAATIMMPQQIDASIKEMCADAMSQAVAALAEKYGFDAEEANRFLASGDLKLARKRGPVPKADKEPKAAKASKESNAAKESKAANEPKPKRAKTGYLLYCDEMRDEVRAKLAGDLCLELDMKLTPQEVVKALGARWKSEDQETKDEWNQSAKELALFVNAD
jgi:hypothetical protein